jgi:SAM-dependent methyltransferase
MKTLAGPALQEITSHTIGHYDASAQSFWFGTKDHDVRQNMDALLRHIQGEAPYTILDFGCGPGRDILAFRDLGHEVVGLDGAAEFVGMAKARTGCEVWHQDFLELDLPAEKFDGIFANASLFHVPLQELPRVLSELRSALKSAGVLFSSNPRGPDNEGWNGQRYGSYLTLETWQQACVEAGFIELEHYYRPAGKPRAEQPWLASVWRQSPG